MRPMQSTRRRPRTPCSLLKYTARHILANGGIRIGGVYEPSTSRAEKLSDAAEGRH